MAKLFSHGFINVASVANGNNPNRSVGMINLINDSKPPHAVFPEPLQFSPKRFPGLWLHTQRPQDLSETAFHIRGQVPDDLRRMGWDIWLEDGHYR